MASKIEDLASDSLEIRMQHVQRIIMELDAINTIDLTQEALDEHSSSLEKARYYYSKLVVEYARRKSVEIASYEPI